MALAFARALPRTTTCVVRSAEGLSRMGFMAASGSTIAAAAWEAWARPISAPSRVTKELSAMFWALNGATPTPSRASQRQMPATMTLFPASEWVPATSTAPLKAARPSCWPARTAPRRARPSPAQKASWVPREESLKAQSARPETTGRSAQQARAGTAH